MASPVDARSGEPSPPAPTPAVIIKTGKTAPAPAEAKAAEAKAPTDVLFHLQVAITPEEHANGLTGRPSLAADAGVLFVFPRPGIQTLSMKDTLIPLDIIFIGADRRIVGIIAKAPARSRTARRIGVASQFVLQIRSGLASQHGFKVGQLVTFQAVPGA